MKRSTLISLGVAVAASTLPLFAEPAPPQNELSIFPAAADAKIIVKGEQGAVATEKDGILSLSRPELTNQPGLRWHFEFKSGLNLDDFPQAAPLKIRLRGGEPGKVYQLATTWYLVDPRGAMGQMVKFKGGPEWQDLTFPVLRRPSGNKTRLLVFGLSDIADIDIAEVKLGEGRDISVELASAPDKSAEALLLRGRASEKDTQITLHVKDAKGKTTSRHVPVKNGRFEYLWENPPLRFTSTTPFTLPETTAARQFRFRCSVTVRTMISPGSRWTARKSSPPTAANSCRPASVTPAT